MSKASHMTEDEICIMNEMINKGYKIEYIAQKLNRMASTVYKHLGKEHKRPYKKWTDADKAKVIALKNKGIGVSEIARRMGHDRIAVYNMLATQKKHRI